MFLLCRQRLFRLNIFYSKLLKKVFYQKHHWEKEPLSIERFCKNIRQVVGSWIPLKAMNLYTRILKGVSPDLETWVSFRREGSFIAIEQQFPYWEQDGQFVDKCLSLIRRVTSRKDINNYVKTKLWLLVNLFIS